MEDGRRQVAGEREHHQRAVRREVFSARAPTQERQRDSAADGKHDGQERQKTLGPEFNPRRGDGRRVLDRLTHDCRTSAPSSSPANALTSRLKRSSNASRLRFVLPPIITSNFPAPRSSTSAHTRWCAKKKTPASVNASSTKPT